MRPRPLPLRVPTRPAATVVALPTLERDDELVEAARAGDVGAVGSIFDRHQEHVRRVLGHILGPDTELEDLTQEVFVGALRGLDALENPSALRAWLGSIAAVTARNVIRRRTRRRWLVFMAPEEVPEVTATAHGEPGEPGEPGSPEAVRAVYRLLGRMPADDRVVFSLRFVSAMELTEVAAALDVSLATVKRRLARAHRRFLRLAANEPALSAFLRPGVP